MPSTSLRIISLLIASGWTGLLLARGRFWDPPVDRLSVPGAADDAPSVAIVVPARNEAAVLPLTLPTLFAQEYAGDVRIALADDNSTDGTTARAHWLATESGASRNFAVTAVPPRPEKWAGKVWALAAGVAAVRAAGPAPVYWLFTDADIAHDRGVLAALVATARSDRRDLVSLMVQLHCTSRWERLLIPAFVFFFAKLYPFAWVADDRHSTAAAAGGCILISDDMLRRIGGIESIAGALIDDCSLAAAVKGAGGRLRLELSTRARSVRPYESLDSIWQMVARSAYTQLRESPLLLAGSVAGMLAMYALPPAVTAAAMLQRDPVAGAGAGVAWLLMSFVYLPIVRRYAQPALAAPLLPVTAALYTLMTLDSARQHWAGRGGAWKGRVAASGVVRTPVAGAPLPEQAG